MGRTISKKQAAERIRQQLFDEATEKLKSLEHNAMAAVFESLGDDATIPAFSQPYKADTPLAQTRQRVDSGDRQAMLDLFMIVARALRHFDALPQNTREALAHGLETTTLELIRGGDFLPKRRGRPPSSIPVGMLVTTAFSTALEIAIERSANKRTVEDAIAMIANSRGLKEDVVKKYWKANRQAAEAVRQQIDAVLRAISSLSAA